MSPSLRPDRLVLVQSFLLPRGERLIDRVVVFESPEGLMIKRVKQVEGDRIWVEGDNQALSIDSREFGWIRKQDLTGVLIGKGKRL
ncbi:hypothetical protein KA531_00590 [Candidatus Saccharibacteria bacterium]|nr:hypothetical protein [Candidatus Saccharibacteria bacterium]